VHALSIEQIDNFGFNLANLIFTKSLVVELKYYNYRTRGGLHRRLQWQICAVTALAVHSDPSPAVV
jgi:hypothetical protein